MHTINHERVLGIAPASKGFGFALLENDQTLVDWGFRSVKGDKNKECLKAIKEMIQHYAPEMIVLLDYANNNAHHSARIRKLGRGIMTLAENQSVEVEQFTREEINRSFFPDGTGTKYAVAESIVKKFPDDLIHWLPPKRKIYKSEDYRMSIFDAVALCFASQI